MGPPSPSLPRIRWLAAAALAASLAPAGARAQGLVTACGSNVEYPPFLYSAKASEDGAPTLAGVAVDLLRYAIAEDAALSLSVRKLPWKRCLKMAELGLVDFVLNVPTAQIDPAPFLISESYAEVHSVYYVSRHHRPQGIPIRNVGDLRGWRICGLIGNRYESYGVPTDQVDRGANNYLSLIGKLHAGHCDLFIEKQEVVDSLITFDPQLARAFTSPDLLATVLPEDSPIGLHFALSRRSPHGQGLIDRIDRIIAQLRRNKTIERWTRSHVRRER